MPAIPPLAINANLERAFAVYLERRKLHLKPRSIQNYQCHFRYLIKFFGASKRLETFHEGDFREYQRWRSLDGPDHGAAGASCINHELNALAQVLALADLWHPISKYYEVLPQKNWSLPRVLTTAEEERFFRFARRRPEGQMAYLASLLTANSTISGCEIRQLQIQDLLLEHRPPRIHVPETVKNRHRVRSVPLNEPALEAARGLLTLANQRGASEPYHYLIPFRVKKGKYDPGRPASSYFIRTSFRRIARSCGLDWITPTSFRHQAITKLLESGAPDETVRAIAGQVSEKAMRYYSHIRIEAKEEAVRRLEKGARPKPVRSAGPTTGMLASVKAAARRLQIPTDAALELILEYERAKSA
jgi:integrase